MYNTYTVEGNELSFSNGIVIRFTDPIVKVLRADKTLVILLSISRKEHSNENVYGISEQGEILWKVPRIYHAYTKSPFTNIAFRDNELILINWDGNDYTVDPSTGSLLKKTFTK